MRRLGWLSVFLATAYLQGLAADRPGMKCPQAVPYRGPELHAPLAADALSGAADSLAGELDPALVKQLDGFLDWIVANSKAPGVTAAVGLPGAGLWTSSRGLASTAPPSRLSSSALFHWASVGKVYTAAVVMQLIDEGKLSYDDPLGKWFPDFPNAQAISIDHLLTHTSGIFSFNADLRFRDQQRYFPPDELLKIAARHGCVFCPGEAWSYSNTGYVLLAQIVEAVEGKPLHSVIQQRLVEPLELRETVPLAPRQQLAGLAVGHVDGLPDPGFEPTTPFGAGIIAASAGDLVRFWQAFLSGRVVQPATVVAAYARLYPMFNQTDQFYGRGVMLYEVPDPEHPQVWLGHSGGTPGNKAVVAYDVEAQAFVAVALNGPAPAEAGANRLLRLVREYRASLK